MKEYLSTLSQGIDDLRQQLKLFRSLRSFARFSVEDFPEGKQRETVADILPAIQSTASLHSFYYSATIVGLYGIFERFIESLASGVVSRITEVAPRYEDLPDAIKANHLPLTLEVLGKLNTGKYQDKIAPEALISGLYSCYAGAGAFSVNDLVFAHHTANYRAETVRQSFERIGVGLQKLVSAQLLVDSMDLNFPGEANKFFVVDDLAERRNEVSHGSVAQLLSVEILESYLDVIECYSRALLRSVISWLVKYAIRHAGAEMGRPDSVFRHSIAGYKAIPIEVQSGDVIAVIDGAGEGNCVGVLSIQVDGVDVDKVQEGKSAGISLGIHLTTRCRLYRLSNDFEYLLGVDAGS